MSNIDELNLTFTNGATLIDATLLYTIQSKMNEVIRKVNGEEPPVPITVDAPTMVLSAGKVILGCTTADATIYYTLNGDTPTSESTQYQSAITLTESCSIKAIAIKSGTSSNVTSKTYSRTSLGTTSWSDNRVIGSNGGSPSTASDYSGVFSICRNSTIPIPSGVTKVCFTRALLTSSDPDGHTAFYSGESGTMDSTNCVGTPEALPKTASEHGTYDTAEINVPEDGARIRITFWTALKENAAIWYESLT